MWQIQPISPASPFHLHSSRLVLGKMELRPAHAAHVFHHATAPHVAHIHTQVQLHLYMSFTFTYSLCDKPYRLCVRVCVFVYQAVAPPAGRYVFPHLSLTCSHRWRRLRGAAQSLRPMPRATTQHDWSTLTWSAHATNLNMNHSDHFTFITYLFI